LTKDEKYSLLTQDEKLKAISVMIFIVLVVSCYRATNDRFDLSQLPTLIVEFDESRNNDILSIMFSLDREQIHRYICLLLKNYSISHDKVALLDLSENMESLYLIDILGYFHDGAWSLISESSRGNPSIMYYLTIELGDGVLPIANINGFESIELYRESIKVDNRIVGTIRVWDVRNMAGGMFLFINFDRNMNMFYKYVHRYIPSF